MVTDVGGGSSITQIFQVAKIMVTNIHATSRKSCISIFFIDAT